MVIVKNFSKLSPNDCVLIPQLSKCLREELNTELTTQKLLCHPLVQEVAAKNKAVMHVICNQCVEKLVLAKGDVLFASATKPKHVFFNLGGDWEYIPQFADQAIELVKKSEWCAEALLWTQWTTQGQLQADLESTALVLVTEKVRGAFIENGILLPAIRRYAQAFLNMMNQQLTTTGMMPNDLQMKYTKQLDVPTLMNGQFGASPTNDGQQ